MNEYETLSHEFRLEPIYQERPKGQQWHNALFTIGFKLEYMPTGTCKEFFFNDYANLHDGRSFQNVLSNKTEFIFNEMKKMKEENL